MPQNDENKLILELKPCSRCGNPFMVKKGLDLTELVCENCIKLEVRKRELQIGVFNEVVQVENKMENSIKEMTNSLLLSCLLYTSDAADDTPCVDLGGRRIIKKKVFSSRRRHTRSLPVSWARRCV